MSSIFTKIINGEIPCYKIYEDNDTIAFLDIAPETRGHTLVVPKKEVDKIYDLEEADFIKLMLVAKKLASHMEKVFGARTIWKVVGTDVPHTHIHLMPQDDSWKCGQTLELEPKEFEEIRAKLEYKEEV